MAEAQAGDNVKVHYTGKLEDGTVFDSSREGDPLGFTLGEGQVIPGFENAVVGMEAGQSHTATLAPDQAYGPRRDDLVIEIGKDQVPDGLDPQVGQNLQLTMQDGSPLPVVVTDVSGDTITLDANHPLAGQTLVFDIELVEVEESA